MTQRSWVDTADSPGFGIENMPYGSVILADGRRALAVRIGSSALLLGELAAAGLLAGTGVPIEVFQARDLTDFLGQGRSAWDATRLRLAELVAADNTEIADIDGLVERALLPLGSVRTAMPFAVGDFVDMYSSVEHATNVGRILRPGTEPLPPNWRHMPIGYHGRSGSVVLTGTAITRPNGQHQPESGSEGPTFVPERTLDFELEMGFVVGNGPSLGTPIPAADAAEYIFGVVLVNDWSARQIQRWEYQPLGPNLSKSFATTISDWVVPLAALEPFRVANQPQQPPPLPHLRSSRPWAFDVDLEVELQPAGRSAQVISRGNSRTVYWNPAQQLAHMTSNGAAIRAGDLYATGTISGAARGSEGSMIELTRAGAEPITVDGAQRSFLEDGDTVTLRGIATRDGVTVSLGAAAGTILPAPQLGGQ